MSESVPNTDSAESAQSTPDLLEATRAAIEQRLRELRPLVAEVPRLERALAALQSVEPQSERPRRAPRTPGRRRGRPRTRGSAGTRADQFLALVRDRPGIMIREAAEAMGAPPTSLYRIAATLEREGTVRREGRGFRAPGTAGAAAPEQPGEQGPPATGVVISVHESGE